MSASGTGDFPEMNTVSYTMC